MEVVWLESIRRLRRGIPVNRLATQPAGQPLGEAQLPELLLEFLSLPAVPLVGGQAAHLHPGHAETPGHKVVEGH